MDEKLLKWMKIWQTNVWTHNIDEPTVYVVFGVVTKTKLLYRLN